MPNDFTQDPYWGKGGRYVVDPATGRRIPAVAADEPQSLAAAQEEAGAAGAAGGASPGTDTEAATVTAPVKPLKEKRRG